MDSVFSPLSILSESSSGLSRYTSSSANSDLDIFVERDEDLLAITLKALTILNEDFDNINKSIYRTILESDGDTVVIQESFSDFFAKIKQIIRKFLSFIQSIFQKFITALNSAAKSEKYLLKHKKDFDRFTSNDNFDIDGYKYTFNPDIPRIELPADFSQGFVGLDFTNTSDILSAEIKSKYSAINNRSNVQSGAASTTSPIGDNIAALHKVLKDDLDGSYYDRKRAEVIGMTDGSISDDDFSEECWKAYRDGEDSAITIEINRTYIGDALGRIESYKKFYKEVEHTRNKIDKQYTDLEKTLDKVIKSNSVNETDKNKRTIEVNNYDGTIKTITMSPGDLTELDSYLKTLTSIVRELSNIHGIAFAAKLQAIKDQYTQDKAALYRALSKCQSAAKIRAAKEAAMFDEEYVGDGEIQEGEKLWII